MQNLIKISKFINPRNGLESYLDETKYLEGQLLRAEAQELARLS